MAFSAARKIPYMDMMEIIKQEIVSEDDQDDVEDQAPAAKKFKPAPHLRRLRVCDVKKRSVKVEPQASDDEDAAASAAQSGAASEVMEPESIRKIDDDALLTHPVLLYLREHTPVRPCGRCQECRQPPCGLCFNCRNNVHLSERSKERRRCISHGCSKLTDEEIKRYVRSYEEESKIFQIEKELRELRDRVENLQDGEIEKQRTALLLTLNAMQAKKASLEAIPDGYECLILSVQTLETERDRVARLVKRRTSRDSPNVMKTRRQLRDYYGKKICELVKGFATDMIAREHVQELIEIADDYEQTIIANNKILNGVY